MENTSDILKMALFNEVKASTFYNRAAEITQNDESRMLLLQFTSMEDDHARMLVKKAKHSPCGREFDAEAYLQELEATMDSTISADEDAILRSGNMTVILELAVKLENHAESTYLELAARTESSEVKDLCLELANIEKLHARQIQQLIQSLSMDEEERPGL